jgi:hypothetical protein
MRTVRSAVYEFKIPVRFKNADIKQQHCNIYRIRRCQSGAKLNQALVRT